MAAEQPSLSVTVSRTEYVPGCAYAWYAGVPSAVVPSPNSQCHFSTIPSWSLDDAPSNRVTPPAGAGTEKNCAFGDWLGGSASWLGPEYIAMGDPLSSVRPPASVSA